MDKLDIPQGTLDLMILTILTREPMHGYGISQRLAVLSHDNFQVNPGSLFPSLYRLEQDGKLKAEWRATREQPQGEVLQAHGVRTEAARTASAALGPHRVFASPACWRAHDAPASAGLGAALGLPSRPRRAGPRRRAPDIRRHVRGRQDARRAAAPRRRGAWRSSSSAASNRRRSACAPIVTAPGSTRSGRDVRYAFRMFVRTPGFTGIIVLTLALGIGANTAIFSLIDALMLRWLPVPNPQELVQLALQAPGPTELRAEPVSPTRSSARSPSSGRSSRASAGFNSFTFDVGAPGFGRPRAWRAGHRRLLRDPGPDPGARASAHPRGRHARRAAGGGRQLRLLGAPARAQPRSGRPEPASQRRSGDRSSASALADSLAPTSASIADITMAAATLPQVSPSAAPLLGPGNFWLRVLARPRAGRVDSAGHGASQRRVAADRRTPVIAPHWPASRRKAMADSVFQLSSRRHRLDLPARDLPQAAAGADGGRRLGAAHRVRERREPAAGARRGAAAERSRCAWRLAPAAAGSCASC